MKVQCPSCKENLHVPDEHLRRGVAKVRCAHCGFGFVIRLGEPGGAPAPKAEPKEDMTAEGFKTSGAASAASGFIGTPQDKFVPNETMTSIRVDPGFQTEIKGVLDIIEEVGSGDAEGVEQLPEPEVKETAAAKTKVQDQPDKPDPPEADPRVPAEPGPGSPFPPAGPSHPGVPHAAGTGRHEPVAAEEESEEEEPAPQAEAEEAQAAPAKEPTRAPRAEEDEPAPQAPAKVEPAPVEVDPPEAAPAPSAPSDKESPAEEFDMKATQPMPLPGLPALSRNQDPNAATLPMGSLLQPVAQEPAIEDVKTEEMELELAPTPMAPAPAPMASSSVQVSPALSPRAHEPAPVTSASVQVAPAPAPVPVSSASAPAQPTPLSPFSVPRQATPVGGLSAHQPGLPPPGFGPSYDDIIVAQPVQSQGMKVLGIIMSIGVLVTGLFFLIVIARNNWSLDVSRFDEQVSRAFSVTPVAKTQDELRAIIVTSPVVDQVRFDTGENALLARGTVKNNDTRTLRYIYVKAWLTRHGRKVTSAEAPAGNTFTVEELTKLSKAQAMGRYNPGGANKGNSKVEGGDKLKYGVIISPLPGDYTPERYDVEVVASKAELYLGGE